MSKGFTILEIVISLFVLSLGVIGVYNAFSIIVVLTSNVSDRLTGAYLAQEGVEIVRNIRDNNWLKRQDDPNWDWKCGLAAGNQCGAYDRNCVNGCEADYTTTRALLQQTGYPLNINSLNFYGYGQGAQTRFQRKIIITPASFGTPQVNVMKVEVHVSWNEKPNILSSGSSASACGSSNCIKVFDTLYDWY